MIKVGIVGCGYWGPNLIRDFSEIDGVKVASCADLSDARLGAIKKRLPEITVTKNADDITSGPGDLILPVLS